MTANLNSFLSGNCSNCRISNGTTACMHIFRTKHKGYGVRAATDIPPHAFVIEYIGEVNNNLLVSFFLKLMSHFPSGNHREGEAQKEHDQK